MLDYNKESLNLSRTQCGPFINLQICSLLWLKVLSVLIESLIRFDQKFDQVRLKVFTNFGWKFDQAFINPDQVRLKVLIKSDWRSLIRFDWKFWSSLIESFINFGWKFWSSFYQFWLKVLIKLLSILIKSDWKFWSSLNESSHQFWLKVLIKLLSTPIKSEWKFWSGFDWTFNFDWKFWSNSSISLVHVISIYPITRVLILLIKFDWKFWSSFDWKFWSGFDWKFNFDWKFWSNSSISLVHVISIYPIARVLILLKVCVRSAPTCPWPSSPWSLGLAPEREPGNNSGYKVAAVTW